MEVDKDDMDTDMDVNMQVVSVATIHQMVVSVATIHHVVVSVATIHQVSVDYVLLIFLFDQAANFLLMWSAHSFLVYSENSLLVLLIAMVACETHLVDLYS